MDVNKVYTNLLKENTQTAKGLYSPFKFKELVKNKGDWDLKNNKNSIFGIGNDGKTRFLFDGNEMESQDIGNHHFGAVGEAYGLFPQEFMLRQAGQAQIDAGTSRPEWQKYTMRSYPCGKELQNTCTETILQAPYGDDPRDQSWIIAGFKYYQNMKK